MIPHLVATSVVGLLFCVRHLRKENKGLAEGNRVLYAALTTRSAQLKYLANIIEEHGIEIDEFDMIVLTQEF
jgi:hypothetical protein